jgi:hypothetical protein
VISDRLHGLLDAGGPIHSWPQDGEAVQDGAQRAPGSGEHREFGLVFANRAHGGLADRGTRDAERWRLDPHFFSSTWADAGVANWTENQGRGGYAAPPVVAPQYAGESDKPAFGRGIGFGEWEGDASGH